MGIDGELYFTLTHEWVCFTDNGTAKVGLTDPLQNLLSTIMFINLPETGAVFKPGEILGNAESMKGVKEIYAPLSGRVIAVNTAATDDPSLINLRPYDTWLVELDDIDGADMLVSPERYETFVMKGE